MTEKKKKNLSPHLILMMIGGFIAFLVWSAFQAAGLGSKVTDTAYYSKGLKYNTTQVEKRAAEVLGWKLETVLKGHALEFHLTDSKNNRISQATGTLYLALPEAAENIHLQLQETVPGIYQVTLDSGIQGSVQARLEMERSGARINRQLLLNL